MDVCSLHFNVAIIFVSKEISLLTCKKPKRSPIVDLSIGFL